MLAIRRGKTARLISSKDTVLPAANCRRDFATISKNSGCELRAKDSRSTFFNGTTAATGLLRSVTTTIWSSNSFAYSASDREAPFKLNGFHSLISLPPIRTTLPSFFPTATMRTTPGSPGTTSEKTRRFPIRSSQGATGFGRKGFRFRLSTSGSCKSCRSSPSNAVDRSRAVNASKMPSHIGGKLDVKRHCLS